ncbi:MAG: hypothetical protein R3F20_10535 [Planctomycetota bacterium]
MPRMKCRILLVLALALAACASPSPDRLDASLPPEEALARLVVETDRGGPVDAAAEVLVVRDRHSTNPGFHRVRDQLARIQRDNRLLVDYLLGRGWSLLGCEFREGPLVDEPDTAQQYRIIRRRMQTDGVHTPFLDGWSVYQPIRFQLMHEGRLEVRGVEDAALYARDLDLFRDYKEARSIARRRNITEDERREALRAAVEAQTALEANTAARGRAAAENLVEAMRESGRDRAILLIGGAHVPAAVRSLEELGLRWRVVESRSYRDPPGPEPEDREIP